MKRYDRGALVIPLFFYGDRYYERPRPHNLGFSLLARTQRVFKEKNWLEGDVST